MRRTAVRLYVLHDRIILYTKSVRAECFLPVFAWPQNFICEIRTGRIFSARLCTAAEFYMRNP